MNPGTEERLGFEDWFDATVDTSHTDPSRFEWDPKAQCYHNEQKEGMWQAWLGCLMWISNV